MDYHIETKSQYTILKKFFDPKLFKLLASKGAYLAGGSISCIFTDRPINDFDIYFEKDGDEADVEHYLKSTSNWTTSYTSAFSKTYENTLVRTISDPFEYGKTYISNGGTMKIQIINAYHGNYKKMFDTFDFYCCMGAFLFKQEEFVFDPNFFADNMSKTLRFNYEGDVNALTSLIRAEKYKGYGYKLPFEEILKIIFSIKKMKLETMGDLRDFIKKLPPGPYKSILVTKIIKEPSENLSFNFNTNEGKKNYDDFINSPCDIDILIGIISDIHTFAENMHDDYASIEE